MIDLVPKFSRSASGKTARRRTALALMAGVSALAAMPANAQSADGSDSADSNTEIVITGSRIAVDVAQVPIATIGAESLSRDGAINVQDALAKLPQVGTGTSRTNTNFSEQAVGAATINLRNLGANRSLVLVNGRRFVPGFSGTSAVDLNNIPTDFIERVEVVTGGASAVYGSEAIAGVVNFILKDEVEGVKLRAQAGLTSRGDDGNYLLSGIGGFGFADGRGHVSAAFSYDKDDGLNSVDRSISSSDRFLATTGPVAFSAYPAQGRFDLRTATGSAGLFTFDTNNQLERGYNLAYGYDRNKDRKISVPVQRYVAAINGKYEISRGAELFFEGNYSKVNSASTLEPWSLYTPDIYDTNDPLAGIPITNAYIPAAIQAQIAAVNSDADPTNDITRIDFRRRQVEVYDRSVVARRETWRAVGGIRGEIGSKWRYDLSYVFGHLTDYAAASNENDLKYRAALDSIVGPDGQIICRSAAARAEGCVPINLFGFGTVTQAAADYVTKDSVRSSRTKNSQHIVTGNLSGSLLTLPAGDLKIAIGGEYHRESSSTDWDALTNLGQNTGVPHTDLSGAFDVWEAYGEVNAPLLANVPFAHYLGATGSIRVSDYSTVGTVLSWNAGLDYAPIDGLRFRGNYAIASRAPNIAELYAQVISGSVNGAGIVDPCVGTTATSTGTYAALCRAIPGLVNGLNGGAFAYSAADFNALDSHEEGNVGLKAEKARTITIGAVATPRFLPGLRLSVDYFDIRITDAIRSLSPSIVVEQCLRTGEAIYCDNVLRFRDTGKLDRVSSQLVNVATIRTRGVDVDLAYRLSPGLAADDRLDLGIKYTRLIDLKQRPYDGAPWETSVGQLGGGGRLGAGFKHKATSQATYSVNGTSVTWQVDFLSKMKDNLAYAPTGADAALLLDYNSVGATFYHNFQLRQAIGDKRRMEFYLGVDNVFDKGAPLIPSGFTSSVTGTETAADTYDVFGRRFYAGVTVGF